jgi:hypothetical protein
MGLRTQGERNRGSKNGLKVGGEGSSYLIWSCGIRAIRVREKGDGVFTVSLNDRLVEKACVSVPFNSPTFFGPLNVIDFLSGLKVLVLLVELLLKSGILLGGMEGLICKDLLFNSLELISSFRFESAPFPKICSQKTSLMRKGVRS